MGLLRLFAFLFPLLLVSCWTPWFDPDLSLAALTKPKLSKDAEFSLNSDYDRTLTNFLAVPVRTRTPNYVTVLAQGWSGYSADTFRNSGGWENIGYRQGRSFDAAVTDPVLIQGFGGMPTGGANWDVAVLEPTLGNGSMEILNSAPMNPYPGSPSTTAVVGAFAAPEPAVLLQDNLFYLEWIPGAPSTLSLSVTTSSDSGALWTLPGANLWGVPYPSTPDYGWIAVDPSNPGGLLYWTHHTKNSEGKYTTDVFDPVLKAVSKSWTRSDHVEAYLTTGKLLTRDGSYYLVCGTDGSIDYSFAAGTLKFAGEFWDPSELRYRMRFTEAIPLGTNGESLFRVGLYSLPTKNLESLR